VILGTILLAGGLCAAVAGAAAAWVVIQGNRHALGRVRVLAYVALLFVSLASIFLLALILAQRYDVAYVYQYTSSDLAFSYRLSAFWAGQQGSFLLWLLLSAILTVLQIRRSRASEPYVLFFLLLVQAGLTVFLLVDSPFQSVGGMPADGYGMNPLLQNPWMVAHPPVLFVGYAGLAVPFAYALGALWRKDYEEWVVHALPWTLIGWFFLGLGIYLGAYWAYETLGWGGYWGWDLVENSSLIPWLTGTALLHGLLIQRYRRRLRHGNFILAGITFLLILYATYLTRSGVLSEISTHSFVDSPLSPWMVGLLSVLSILNLGLLVTRWRSIPRGPVFADASGKKASRSKRDVVGTVGQGADTWFSRDFTFLLTILLLLFLAAPIWVGTLVPMITRVKGAADALDVAFYPRTTAPFLALLLAVLSLCPFLGWRGSGWDRLRRFLVLPSSFALVTTVVAFLVGARQPLSLLFVLLGAFSLASNLAMLIRTARGGLLRVGGYLAHVGLGLLVVGLIASSVYSVDGPPMALREGQPQEALDYRFTFEGWGSRSGNPALVLKAERGGKSFVVRPQLYLNPQDGTLVATPHVRRFLTHDLYVAAEGYEPAQQGQEVPVGEGQTVSAGEYTLTLEELIASDAEDLVVLSVEGEWGTTVVTPTYAADGSGRTATLPDGEAISVREIYLPPPGLLLLVEGEPVDVGTFRVTLKSFTRPLHDTETGLAEAGVAVEFVGPEASALVTPTLAMGGETTESRPQALFDVATVSLTRMSVEQRAAWIEVEGLDLPRQTGFAWLWIEDPASAGGVARVHASIKPGMNLLWGGGLLLLVGTALAIVRRWLEGQRQEQLEAAD
jgi:cytochrome c-type biogenesis protein CcmF